ncbi:MAG: cytochrome c3 family protein [Rhodocyclaceae bacterium]
MKAWKKALLVSLATAAPAAMAATPAAGLHNTRHDFAFRAMFLETQTVAGGGVGTVGGVGLCTYCHTPHNAQSTALLWNHTLSANTFTWDEAKTAGGTTYASLGPTYKGPTVKCLSCHDASVAIGDVSMYKEHSRTGAGNELNTFKVGDTWSGDATGKTIFRIGVGGTISGSHPVGMPYPYNNASSTYNSITTGGDVIATEFEANPHTPAAAAPANPTIKLYNDNAGTISAGPVAGSTGIECSSCHDPHNKQTSDDLFLRGKLAGADKASGYICVQCHIK